MEPVDVRALARRATAVENGEAAPGEYGGEGGGEGLIVGITGAPGAGKSSLVDAMTSALRAAGKTVAIIAVDPSSRTSGGAILGDRIRMQRHYSDPGIFIRSMATRGAAGGLAQTTANVAKLFRSAGFDYVLIETVGVGQDEIAVARSAEVTVVVLVPGMGDDVQAIKAGIMEIADVFAINKADYPGAAQTRREVQAMLSLAHGPNPAIVETVATESKGIAELMQAIDACPRKAFAAESGFEIDHLGIAVRSVDAALGFYEKQLGMAVQTRETVAAERVNVAMLPAADSRIELLEPTDAESTIARFIEKRGEGLHHIALKVADLAGTVQRLRDAGARILGEPRAGAGGHRYVFVHPASTGGVLLELIQK